MSRFMKCDYCEENNWQVKETDRSKSPPVTRTRVCKECGARLKTQERPIGRPSRNPKLGPYIPRDK